MPLTDEEMRREAIVDFARHRGRLILVSSSRAWVTYDADVGGPDCDDDFDFDPSLLCRVVDTDEGDLLHQCDKDYVDPYWDVEILDGRQQAGFRVDTLVLYGNSVNRIGLERPHGWRLVHEDDSPKIAYANAQLGYY